jgi:hypothetical protein
VLDDPSLQTIDEGDLAVVHAQAPGPRRPAIRQALAAGARVSQAAIDGGMRGRVGDLLARAAQP